MNSRPLKQSKKNKRNEIDRTSTKVNGIFNDSRNYRKTSGNGSRLRGTCKIILSIFNEKKIVKKFEYFAFSNRLSQSVNHGYEYVNYLIADLLGYKLACKNFYEFLILLLYQNYQLNIYLVYLHQKIVNLNLSK